MFNWLFDNWPWSAAGKERRAFRAIDTIYQTNWLARRGIDQPVEDMFKAWRRWDKPHREEMKKAEKKHKLKKLYKDSTRYARLYGGIVVIPLLKGQDDLEKPLDLDSIEKGDLIKLLIFDRWYVGKTEVNYTNPVADDYLRPKYYTLPLERKGQSMRVHYSRVIERSGLEVPLHQKRQGILWGMSWLLPVLDTINQYTRAIDSTARLIDEQTIDVLKKEGWAESSTTEQREEMETHMDWVARIKRTRRMMVGDKKDEFDRKTITTSGVSNMIDALQEDVSGGFRMPVTLLFGKAKAGMSGDTNDGDIRNYNNTLVSQQDEIGESMELADEIVIRSTYGEMPENIEYDWSPLDAMTGTEKAKALSDTVDAAQKAIESGMIAPEETRPIFDNDSDFMLDETKYKAHVEELKRTAAEANQPKQTKQSEESE